MSCCPMMKWSLLALVAMVLVGAGFIGQAYGADAKLPGYTDTPIIPGQKWRVHDANRPRPKVVTPEKSKTLGMKPPKGATVLFDGKSVDNLKTKWKVENGYMEVSKGGCSSKNPLGDMYLHLEFATPKPPKGSSQGRGNSGVIIMGKYEVQVLDSYKNMTYADGQCAALYGQTPPMVNACLPPGEWQTYDIWFQAPRWKEKELISPAVVTVIQNGVKVHDKRVFIGQVSHKRVGKYFQAHPEKLPLQLQNHGNPMRFRNIWYRDLTDDEKVPAAKALAQLKEYTKTK
jgi:hypothetical protein